MGYRNILVNTAFWLGAALVLPHTTIAASFLAPQRSSCSDSNGNKSLQWSLPRWCQVREQHFHLNQDASSARRRFLTRSLLWQSGDGAEDTELDDPPSLADAEPQSDTAWIAEEHQKPSMPMSQFAFQRSLLAARLAMEAGTSLEKESSVLQQEVIQEMQASDEPSNALMLDEPSESASIQIDTELEATPVADTALPTPFAFQQALLKARLEMDTRKREITPKDDVVVQGKDGGIDALLNEEISNVQQEGTVNDVLEGTEVESLVEDESKVTADTEAMQDESVSPESQIAGPTSASEISEILATEEASSIAAAEDMQTETDSPASQIEVSASIPSTSAVLSSDELSSIDDSEDTAAPASQAVEPTFTSGDSEGSVSEESLEVAKAVAPPPEPKTTTEEPTYWQTLSSDKITSLVMKSVTPEKGLGELNEEADADLLAFAASQLASGLIQGGKAAFFSVKAAARERTEEPAVAAASEATQKLVSALAALTALGFRGAERGLEYAQKVNAERVEAAKKAEAARKVEEEKKRIEAERVAAEMKLEDEASAAEERAFENIRARAEEAKKKVEEEKTMAEKMAIDEVRTSTEMKKQLLREMQNDVAGGPAIFFADEI